MPVGAVKVDAEVDGSVGLNGKRTRSVAIDDLVAIQEERERQGQKREVERGARAERAAARLQRDALSATLDSSRSSDSESRSSGMEALLRWQSPREGVIASADFIPAADVRGRA